MKELSLMHINQFISEQLKHLKIWFFVNTLMLNKLHCTSLSIFITIYCAFVTLQSTMISYSKKPYM